MLRQIGFSIAVMTHHGLADVSLHQHYAPALLEEQHPQPRRDQQGPDFTLFQVHQHYA